MVVVRFGKKVSTGGFPTENAFREKIGRSGFARRFTRSNQYLDEIYRCLRRARKNPNDMTSLRKLRKACARWVIKKGVGQYTRGEPSRRQEHIVELGLAAHERYYRLVNRMYLDRGRQARLDARIAEGDRRDALRVQQAGEPVGKKLSNEYKLERHTDKHVSHHVTNEKHWTAYKTKYSSRLGFEDWIDMIAIPDREDRVHELDHLRRNGGADLLKKGVQYLDDEQREDFRITCDGSRLIYAVERTPATVHTAQMGGTTGAAFGIYVIDFQKNIYLAKPETSRFHHSTFLAGTPVFAAGEMAIQHGVLRGINNKTGHYKAGRDELYQTLRLLQTMGVPFHNAVTQDRSLVHSKWRKVSDVLRAQGDFDDAAVQNTQPLDCPAF